MKKKSITIIIPNYNGQRLLVTHLPSVFEAVRNGDQIIIADDHSSDNSIEWLKKTYDLVEEKTPDRTDYFIFSQQIKLKEKTFDLTVILNKQNLRFAANCNQAAKLAKNELLFLLNSDVELQQNLFTYLLPYFDDETVFGVGCLEEENDLKGQTVLGGKNKLSFQRGMFIHQRATEMSSGPTAWVSGGSGLFDREKWQSLGGFDEAFSPAYWEDVDLSFRARERGWKVLFENRAKVLHNHEATNSDVF